MTKVRISIGMDNMSDPELIELAADVSARLNGNLSFPTPYPPVANLDTAATNLINAVVAAHAGGKTETTFKNQKRMELLNVLTLLGSYVEDNSDNNAATLLSSGFGLRGEPTKHDPVVPYDLRMKDGLHSGEAILSFKGSKYNLVYEVRYCEDMVLGNWKTTGAFTKKKKTLTGLNRGKDIWVQVRATNANGISEWSDPAVWMVR